MNSAILMMLKSMGFDPEEVINTVNKMGQLVAEMHASQVRTEQAVNDIKKELEGILLDFYGPDNKREMHRDK
jgi:hypothetical protein